LAAAYVTQQVDTAATATDLQSLLGVDPVDALVIVHPAFASKQ
jgi:hypothetical protein